MIKQLFYLVITVCALTACNVNRKPDMPQFNVLLTDSTTVLNTGNIPTGRPIVLIYFEPDCEYCQEETKGIVEKMDSLKDASFYFISYDSMHKIKYFHKYFKLERFNNITFARDYENYFPKNIPGLSIPYVAVYNKYKQLRVVFPGQPNLHNLVQSVHDLK